MRPQNLVLALFFLIAAAAVNAHAQFGVTGTVSGRIMTADGSGIRRASVTVMNLSTLETQIITTNDFGYFRVGNLPIMDVYLISVRAKKYSFAFPNQVLQFLDIEQRTFFIAEE